MTLPLRIDTPFFPHVPKPRLHGHLDVGDGHAIYWEETGEPDGVPVLVLHGGPGGLIKPYYRRLLDPARHRGVFFDQRGCGRSTAAGSLSNNDLQALIGDMEKLRKARGIEKWIVVGGSWGSTLALAYAQTHPEHVSALLLTGVFLARATDHDWTWHGVGAILPEVVGARDAYLGTDRNTDPRAEFAARILGPDSPKARQAALVYATSEMQTLDLFAPASDSDTLSDAEFASVRIQIHYDSNDYFLTENQLIENVSAIAEIPGAIIAGRADLCTPPQGAYDLAKAWPMARLQIVAAAGHRWNDEALGRYIIAELERLTGLVAGR
jgi:proline iminopeptidase